MQAKLLLLSMQQDTLMAVFGKNHTFCTPVVLVLINAPTSTPTEYSLEWQDLLQACWASMPKPVALQNTSMQSIFQVRAF